MNDLVLSIKLEGDAGDLNGEVRVSQKEFQKLATSEDQATHSAKKLSSESNNLSGRLAKMSGTVAKVAGIVSGLATGAMALAVKRALDFGDGIQKLSIRLGASTEALSEYNHVAQLTGVSFEQLTTSWQRQTRRIAEAANGAGEAKDAIHELGLSAVDLAQLRPEEQFEILADALSNVESESDRVRLAMKLWDSEGVALLQTVDGGSESLRKMRDEAHQLGLTLSREQVDQMAAANDAITRMSASGTALANTLAIHLGPTIESVTNWLNVNMPSAIEFAKDAFDSLRDFILSGAQLIAGGLSNIYEAMSVLPGSYGEAYARAAEDMRQVQFNIGGLREAYQFAKREAETFTVTGREGFKQIVVGASAASQAVKKLSKEQEKSGQALMATLFPEEASFDQYAEQLNTISQMRQAGLIDLEKEQEAIDQLTIQYLDLDEEVKETGKTSSKTMKSMAQDTSKAMRIIQQSTDRAMWSAENSFVNFAKTGKLEIRDLIDTILDEMLRLLFRQNFASGGTSLFSGLFGGMFGGGGDFSSTPGIDLGSFGGATPIQGSSWLSGLTSLFSFGDGGIMTSAGPMPLQKYGDGGVVNGPQFRVAGERYQPEAIIPLPNGRSVPVEMTGGGSPSIVFSPNYNITAGSGADKAEIYAIARRTSDEAVAKLMQQINRGGNTAKIVGRRR